MILGTGEVNLPARLDVAKEQNCHLVVETKTVEALRKSIDWLQEDNNEYKKML